MTIPVEGEISSFVKHFRSALSRLTSYDLHPEDRFLKKTALCSVLDALSIVTSPSPQAGNRDRVIHLIDSFSTWSDSRRLSAPHLERLLPRLADERFSKARGEIERILQCFQPGEFVSLNCDPRLEDIAAVWPVSIDQKVDSRLSLSSFTHASIFYFQRNNLVHEFREAGYGMEFHSNHADPFYHAMSVVEEGETRVSFELVYPTSFYFSLVESVVDNLESHLVERQINPYSFYQFGSSWITGLNENT